MGVYVPIFFPTRGVAATRWCTSLSRYLYCPSRIIFLFLRTGSTRLIFLHLMSLITSTSIHLITIWSLNRISYSARLLIWLIIMNRSDDEPTVRNKNIWSYSDCMKYPFRRASMINAPHIRPSFHIPYIYFCNRHICPGISFFQRCLLFVLLQWCSIYLLKGTLWPHPFLLSSGGET